MKEEGMRRALFMTLGVSTMMLVLACGGGATATLAPGATPAPVGATVAPPPVGNICAGVPTFSPQTPGPVYPSDDVLKAKFPAEIGGNPVTNVQTGYYVSFICVLGDAEDIAKFSQTFGGNAAALTYGSGKVTVGDEDVTISAFRLAGGDSGQMIQNLGGLAAALGGDPEELANVTTTQTTMGGKPITVLTDADGDVTWIYPSGDTLWSVEGDTSEEAAGTVFAALP
jgi:hypothetical protein